MPKNLKQKVKDVHQLKKGKFKHDHASTIYLQVVGSGAHGAPRSLYVFTEHCRYFFNCGEGTQRLASEHKVKLSMLEHVLITHKTWENVGGLPGALLTLQDSGVPKITIHGPPGIESLYNDTKHFMRFSNLQISYHHYESNDGLFDEGPLLIQAVPLWPEHTLVDQETLEGLHQETEEVEDMFAHEKNSVPLKSSNSPSENPVLKKQKLQESVKCKDLSIAYICRPVPKPGALLPHRCRELGVPLGPLMGELKRGKDVTLLTGNVVKATDVTEPPDLGPVFIVIEVPSESHVGTLASCSAFLKYQEESASKQEDVAAIVIHFTPPRVLNEPRYREWISKFPITTTHIYVNENSQCMGSERVHKIQYKLNHLYPDSFPLLYESEFISKCGEGIDGGAIKRMKRDSKDGGGQSLSNGSGDRTNNSTELSQLRGNDCQAFTRLTYHIRPHLKTETSKGIEINPKEFIRECYEIEEFKSTYDKVRKKVDEVKANVPSALKEKVYPNFLFLGTGSCIPNKTRNTSGTALYISATSTMLLDCGEGTFGQLVRYMGSSAADGFLRQLRVVYISHLHADHHIGFIRILLARKMAFERAQLSKRQQVPKLVLLAPKGIMHYLTSYSANFEFIADQFTLVPNKCLTVSDDLSEERKKVMEYWSSLGIQDVKTCFVYHCPNAYGVAITLEDGWKVVYSGDTMPCQALVNIGEDCDVLIHEATMEDELKEDAKMKRHSTTSEAVEIGVRMKAKHIILTHFSQRYAKVPLLDEVPQNVGVAFDNMRIHLSDLHCLSHLYPAYVSIFSEDVDEMLKKRMKIKTRNEVNENKS